MANEIKTQANGWYQIATFYFRDGRKIEVWQRYHNHWLVEYYSHQGVHMDGSDQHFDNQDAAMQNAQYSYKE
jgi:hypothetical protein